MEARPESSGVCRDLSFEGQAHDADFRIVVQRRATHFWRLFFKRASSFFFCSVQLLLSEVRGAGRVEK